MSAIEMDLKALIVSCPDGEAALLDHIYVGRHPTDFDSIPAPGQATRLP